MPSCIPVVSEVQMCKIMNMAVRQITNICRNCLLWIVEQYLKAKNLFVSKYLVKTKLNMKTNIVSLNCFIRN